MSKLDLNEYTDRQIVSALVGLRIDKFMTVMNAVGTIVEQYTQKGKKIAVEKKDSDIEDFMRRLFEGGK